MASPNYTRVSQSTIDELRKNGMAENLKKARSGTASPEFVEAVRRFYPSAFKDVKSDLMRSDKSKGQGNTPSVEKKADTPKETPKEAPRQSSYLRTMAERRARHEAKEAKTATSTKPAAKPVAKKDHKDLTSAMRRRLMTGTTKTGERKTDRNADGNTSLGEYVADKKAQANRQIRGYIRAGNKVTSNVKDKAKKQKGVVTYTNLWKR